MPGGGSLVATNYVYSVAKPDGLTVGMPNQLVYMGQVVGDKEARFDVQKFNWIGSPDRNPTVLFIRADTPYKSIDDIIKGQDSSEMWRFRERQFKHDLCSGGSSRRQI